jgi:Bacterial Ig-like domain (group 2)./Regulator of chromosome condensation (RCC1) repeat.
MFSTAADHIMPRRFPLVLILFATLVAGIGCEPTAEERALARVAVVRIAGPGENVPLFIGQTAQLTATALDAAFVEVNEVPLNFSWESSDPQVLSVDQNGMVTAKGIGSAAIYARLSNGVYGSYSMSSPDPIEVYSVNPDSARMLPGQQKRIALQPFSKPDILQVFGWMSSNPAVATVTDNGLITAVSPGLTTISTTYANRTFRSEVYVADVATPLRFASVTTEGFATCGLATDGTAYCWGSATGGVLGSTERIDHCVIYDSYVGPAGGSYSRRVETCAMEPVRVETTQRFASLESYAGTICGTTSAGEAYCWGATGGLAGGSTGPTVVPVSDQLRFTSFSYPCGVSTGGDAWCFGDPALRGAPATASTTPTQVTGAGIWHTVAATSSTHRCGVTTDGVVQCWGSNGLGELGTGNTTASSVPVPIQSTERFSAVAVNTRESCAVSLSGLLYCWGNNVTAPTVVSTSLRFTAVSMWEVGLCALGTDAVQYCRIGTGALADAASGLHFRTVGPAGLHQCGVAQDGIAYCWGSDLHGELGIGEVNYGNPPTAVAGQ